MKKVTYGLRACTVLESIYPTIVLEEGLPNKVMDGPQDSEFPNSNRIN
jgi:hypothetical protein